MDEAVKKFSVAQPLSLVFPTGRGAPVLSTPREAVNICLLNLLLEEVCG